MASEMHVIDLFTRCVCNLAWVDSFALLERHSFEHGTLVNFYTSQLAIRYHVLSLEQRIKDL